MTEATVKRGLYQGAYRNTLEEEDTQVQDPASHDSNTSDTDPESPEEKTWKKRYGDLRSHQQSLIEEVKSLKNQLHAALKKEVTIPSTKEEIEDFTRKYPDVTRHIRSMILTEVMSNKEDLIQETKVVKEDLEKLQRERAIVKIMKAHPDFDELNQSNDFHEWVMTQPKSIQHMLYESPDPDECIAAIDLYKAYHRKKPGPKPRPQDGADTLVTRGKQSYDDENSGKRTWKESEIAKLHPRQYEQLEAEIDAARREGRFLYGE